jgi:hypothetical protein
MGLGLGVPDDCRSWLKVVTTARPPALGTAFIPLDTRFRAPAIQLTKVVRPLWCTWIDQPPLK